MDYRALISEIEAFDIESAREHIEHSIGKKDDLAVAAIYDRHKTIFGPAVVRWVRKYAVSQDSAIDKRRASYLLDFAIDGIIGHKLRHLTDEEAGYEAKATVKLDNADVPYRQLPVMLQNEEKRRKRQLIVKLAKPVKRKLTSYEKKAMKVVYTAIAKHGGKDYVSYYAEHKDVDLDALAATLRGFLLRTDALFSRRMERRLATIKVPLAKAESHDYSHLMRTKQYDGNFPKDKLVPTLKRTFAGMGIDIETQKNVHLDVEDRPKKVPRAFCSPIRIPEEIWLVTKPHGGQQDYQSILHEAGHTEHFAHTNKDLPYELKHMGGHAVSESYAFLFEYLTTSTTWLQDIMAMQPATATAFVDELIEQKLFMFRRYAAKLLYELKLHRQDLTRLDEKFESVAGRTYADFGECYSDILGRACKVKYPKENWLIDVDGGFYSADYLRAWMLEAHLRNVLEKRHGARWYADLDAGTFLANLWRHGSNGKTINEIAAQLGVPLDTSAIEKDFGRLNA